jgi:hypothetical protein
MRRLDLTDCDDCNDVMQTYPVFAGAVAILIGAVTYAVISVVLHGSVRTIETGLFAVVFGVGYTGMNYLRTANPIS